MRNQLIKLKLPEVYKENLIEYTPGLDICPQWPELKNLGYSWKKHLKLMKFVSIEGMKYQLKEAIEYNELTEEEIKKCEKMIKRSIEEYNNMQED